MHILDIIDKEQLQSIQDIFSKATGLAVICIDSRGEYLTKGSGFTDFCMNKIRTNEEGLRRCQQCDKNNKGIYKCHAGLMDFSFDIILEGYKLGAIIGGQILPNEPNVDDFKSLALQLGLDEKELIESLKLVPVRSKEQIEASANLLNTMINDLISSEYFKKKNLNKITVIEEEKHNLDRYLKEIKTALYNLDRISQTEGILSINASIEANKAGSYASGFSVVAKEMGELSNSSKRFYSKILDTVNSLEKSINNIKKV